MLSSAGGCLRVDLLWLRPWWLVVSSWLKSARFLVFPSSGLVVVEVGSRV